MIYWDLILKTDNICDELRKLYTSMSLRVLAEYLGVSRASVRKKLVECGVPLRPRGGPHYRIPRSELPENATDMTPAQLAKLTGYSVNYCRKLRRKLKEEK